MLLQYFDEVFPFHATSAAEHVRGKYCTFESTASIEQLYEVTRYFAGWGQIIQIFSVLLQSPRIQVNWFFIWSDWSVQC